MKEFSDRLKYALRVRGINQSELARAIGVKPQAIQYLCREGKKSVHSVKISEVLNIRPKWLTDGTGEMEEHTDRRQAREDTLGDIKLTPIQIIEWNVPEDLPDDQYALVPRIRLKLSAGNGSLVTEELPDAPLAFTTEWIKRKGVKRDNLVVVNAVGDSMEPTICCGALLLIDLSSTDIIDGKVYALRYGDELRVKRLYKRYDGGIIIRSDNQQKYPDEILTAADLNDRIYVIGQAIWQAGDL